MVVYPPAFEWNDGRTRDFRISQPRDIAYVLGIPLKKRSLAERWVTPPTEPILSFNQLDNPAAEPSLLRERFEMRSGFSSENGKGC